MLGPQLNSFGKNNTLATRWKYSTKYCTKDVQKQDKIKSFFTDPWYQLLRALRLGDQIFRAKVSQTDQDNLDASKWSKI